MAETHSAYTDTETLIRLLDVAEGMPGAIALRERGYMRFHEWPSGHWAVTDKGREFLSSLPEN